MRLLVVEDDPAIAGALADGLSQHGFEVVPAADGASAIAASGYDLVLLDLGLPDLDGVEVARRLRAQRDVPIIVVSARDDELDRVLLLESGADDYVTKPFGLRELVARIRAVSRRHAGGTAPAVEGRGPLRIDARAHTVTVDGVEVALTPKEFELLVVLARDPGAVCTRSALLEEVWDTTWYGSTKTLDVHMASLRRKLGHPEWLVTLRGVGFRLDLPEH